MYNHLKLVTQTARTPASAAAWHAIGTASDTCYYSVQLERVFSHLQSNLKVMIVCQGALWKASLNHSISVERESFFCMSYH